MWLDGHNIKTYHPMAKLALKRHGPFPIERVLSPIIYQLTLPEQWKIHDMFHVDLLTPYREMEFHSANYNRPPPDLVGEEEQYEVEQVLDERIHGRWKKKQYLCHDTTDRGLTRLESSGILGIERDIIRSAWMSQYNGSWLDST